MALTGRRCRQCGCADLQDTITQDRNGTWLTVSGVCRHCGKRTVFGRIPHYTFNTRVLCTNCGLLAKVKSTQGAVRYMKCDSCGNKFNEIGRSVTGAQVTGHDCRITNRESRSDR